jgi:hypothetical protein
VIRGGQIPGLSSALPHDVDIDTLHAGSDPDDVQEAFDVFSWESFVALVWPVNADGTPGPSLVAAQRVPRWRTFRDARELTPPHGLRPFSWASGRDARGVPLRNHGVSDARFSWVARSVQSDGKTLWDRNGQPVYYQSLVNEPLFDYVVTHGLYSVDGQRAFAPRPTYLPPGLYWNKDPSTGEQVVERAPSRSGSIALKAAWKVLGEDDDAGRFHVSSIPVRSAAGTVAEVEAALVGLHIAHKTQTSASWVWSTFEHVDALADHEDPSAEEVRPLFRDRRSAEPPNRLPAPDRNGRRRTQVARIVPVGPVTEEVNRRYRAALAELGSPWRHFRLLGTQRMVRTQRLREPEPVPRFLVNPVFETYVPLEEASALDAHRTAQLSVEGGSADADFVFLLRGAARAWSRTAALEPRALVSAGDVEPESWWRSLPGLQASEGAQLETVVPQLEWLVRDGDRRWCLRREDETGGIAIYAEVAPDVEDDYLGRAAR